MKPLFITFEGIEGSGKSTQVGLLASKMRERGLDIEVTREPGGSRVGEQIRTITHSRENVDLTAIAEAYLMAASRAQHVREIIKPALETGKTVICDRFIDSSLAYQGYGREIGQKAVLEMNRLALSGVWPDITFLLDISIEEGFDRRNHTDKIDRLDLQQKDFYQRVYDGYRKLAEKYKNRYIVIDSSRQVKKVADEIWKKVNKIIQNE